MHFFTILGAFFLTLSVFAQAPAKENNQPKPDEDNPNLKIRLPEERSQVGVALAQNSRIYKGGDERFPAIPFFAFNYRKFYFLGVNLGYRLYQGYPMIDLTLSPSFQRLKPEDGTFSEGLHYRHATAHAGINFRLPTPYLMFNANFQHDILGRHKSWISRLSAVKFFPITKQLSIAPGLQYSFYSSKYTDYYFGVDDDEVATDRPYYKPSASFEWGPTISLPYQITERWNVALRGSFSWLSSDIKNSPLIERDHRWIAILSISYLL